MKGDVFFMAYPLPNQFMRKGFFIVLLFSGSFVCQAQIADPVVDAILKEANENSQLEKMAHELFDGIGPRLVGTPQMQQAHDWAVAKYTTWGIAAKNEKWGEWRGWERGTSHIDMVYPRVKSLEGTQLAWSPATGGKAVIAEVIIIPDVADSIAFQILDVERLLAAQKTRRKQRPSAGEYFRGGQAAGLADHDVRCSHKDCDLVSPGVNLYLLSSEGVTRS